MKKEIKRTNRSEAFLYDYLNNDAPVGYETNGQKIWLDYLTPYIDDHFIDSYGTAVGIINPQAKYKVVIEAHADEIAWYVNYINKEGYLYVTRSGGSDYHIAPSQHVKIYGDKGVLPAVFGWPAIHVRKDRSKPVPDISTIILDAGFASDKEAKEAGVHVGTVAVFDQQLSEINEKFWVGKALDNRIGGFAIAEVARKLSEEKKKLPFALYIVNSVQEEVGLRGAKMIAEKIKPHLAIITDVTHDTQSPLYKKIEQGDIACGKGPVISVAAAVQRNVRDMLIKVAQEKEIPFQYMAASYQTGTDTDAFAYAHTGIPSALLSIPLKYMHTTVEMVHREDVSQLVDLLCHFLSQLQAGHNFSYLPKG